MEPFSKDDPLHHLLGKARSVEPRANFTRDVMRAVRNTPQIQRHEWWKTLVASLRFIHSSPSLWNAVPAMAALVIAALLISLNFKSPSSVGDTAALDARSSPVVSATSLPQQPEPDTMVAQVDVSATEEESLMTSELDTIDRLSVLLSSQDTSNLTDGELAMLLY